MAYGASLTAKYNGQSAAKLRKAKGSTTIQIGVAYKRLVGEVVGPARGRYSLSYKETYRNLL